MASVARQCANSLRARRVSATPLRAFSTASPARKDFVQELYLSQLKAYKPSPQAASAAQGQVRDFSMPASPQAPLVPSGQELSSEMESWEAVPAAEAQAPSKEGKAEESSQSADEYLNFLERDHPKADAHH